MKLIALFIKRIIYFLLFIVFFYLIGIIAYGEFVPKYLHQNIFYEKFAYGFSNTRFKEVKNIDDIDILFLGSSRSYRHYDPRIFKMAGFTSFNLGSSSQTFLQTEILVKRYLKTLDPEYVVLDIYPGMFSSDGVESSFDLISNDTNSWDTLEMALKLENIKIFNTWIYAIYKEYFWNSMDEDEKLIKGNNNYVAGGYVERIFTTSDIGKKIDQDWEFDNLQIESFNSIIKILKDYKTKIIVVHSPRHRNIEYCNNEKLKNLLKFHDLEFYNYKVIESLEDTSHFYDASHLNQKGVEIYNKAFLKEHF